MNFPRISFWVCIACGLFLPPPAAEAGGPLAVSTSGDPYTWDNSGPVEYHPDQGSLGLLDNAAAVQLIEDAFAIWSGDSIPTVDLNFANGGSLSKDVSDVTEYLKYEKYNGGVTAVIFDTDGSIIADLGLPPEVVGFAGPEVVTTASPYRILEGIALLNGAYIDGSASNGELSQEEYTVVFKHEFGHLLNLDHTQVNGQYFLADDDPGFVRYGPPPIDSIQMMFPFFFEGLPGASVPLSDDIAAVSALYPSSGFQPPGSVSGTVYEPDGTTMFQGANIIARNEDDPFFDAVSGLSGTRYCPGCTSSAPPPPELEGFYEIKGLTQGADYSIEAVNVNSEFTEGSSIGPIPEPRILCGPEEFYDDAESNADDPMDSSPVDGSSANAGLDIVLNETGGKASISSASLSFGTIEVGAFSTQILSVRNSGTGLLYGQASVSPPFYIVSGGSYSLQPDETQSVRVSFEPDSGGTYSGTVIFSCGGGSVAVKGVSKGGSGNGSNGKGCFIATAAFGSPLEEHVGLLRRFRDRVLMHLGPGRWAVHQYYRLSPPAALKISEHETLKRFTRWALLPLVGMAWLTVSATPAEQWLCLAAAGLCLFAFRKFRIRGALKSAKR